MATRLGGARRRRAAGNRSAAVVGASSSSAPCWNVTRKRRARFEQAGGAAYITDVLSNEDEETVRRTCRSLRARVSGELGSTAVSRLGCVVECDKVRAIFEQEYVAERITAAIGAAERVGLARDVPLEYRVYRAGSRMDWHFDDLLYESPQYEIVFTVENDSDATTEWQDVSARVHGAETLPNSCLIVRAGQSYHRVRKLRRGERGILKLVFVAPDAVKLASFASHFSSMYV